MTPSMNRPLLLFLGIALFFCLAAFCLSFPKAQFSNPPSAPSPKSALAPQAATAPQEFEKESDAAFRFYRQIALENQEKNIFFSPWSINYALTLCYLGADGKTAQEIQEALSLPTEIDELAKMFENSDSVLEVIRYATGIWVQKGWDVDKNFSHTVRKYFQGGFQELDFASQRGEAVLEINKWVAEKTNGMIPSFLDSVEGDRIIVGSAIYFKGSWAAPFDPAQTKNQDFFPEKEKSVAIPMMTQTSYFQYADTKTCQWIELPYKDTPLSLTIIAPKSSFGDFEKTLNSTTISESLAASKRTQIKLTMPLFKSSGSYSLKPCLEAMGIRDAFSKQNANFGKMTSTTDVYLEKVQHGAMITVDEKGTEASAVTTAHARPKFVSGSPVELVLNKPFIYLIRDQKTQKIYFIGRYVQPQ